MLRDLRGKLSACLATDRQYKFDIIRRNTLDSIADDLGRLTEELASDTPLLVVMFMGGTGVGKSTLLNALAGATIAQASFTRPTTRDPVVYFHESVRPERLDPALRHCRLQTHDRDELRQKVLVDTPDLDSNDLANREKLASLLPVADVVLYVGSQEKYHDRLGWDLFREQRQRRAFAFIMNKWDRCRQGEGGVRPDDDLLCDLKNEGFDRPLLFRTTAQLWLDRPNGQPPPNLPAGEQFNDLVNWLETGLTRLEIEAIKARGVLQLLNQLGSELEHAAPPDLAKPAEQVRTAWDAMLKDEASADTEILLSTLDPHQLEIENHFSVQGQHRFWGLMRGYLKLFSTARTAGTTLRDKLSIFPSRGQSPAVVPTWDLTAFTHDCIREAGERFLDNRISDLTRRLLIEGEERGFPYALLAKPTEDAGKLDWRHRDEGALREALQAAEQVWTKPTGTRRWLQVVLVGLANILPNITILAAYLVVLWKYFMEKSYDAKLFDLIMPLALTLIVMVVMQVLITLLLPMRWAAIRGEFQRQLGQRLLRVLREAYLGLPGEVATALQRERRQIEELNEEVRSVAAWLQEREQKSNITPLYGSTQHAV
jgi:hypothetical protein